MFIGLRTTPCVPINLVSKAVHGGREARMSVLTAGHRAAARSTQTLLSVLLWVSLFIELCVGFLSPAQTGNSSTRFADMIHDGPKSLVKTGDWVRLKPRGPGASGIAQCLCAASIDRSEAINRLARFGSESVDGWDE
jgi:hypothetical protein